MSPKSLKKRATAAAEKYAKTTADDLSGFDYFYEDAVVIRDTGRRSVRAAVIEVDGRPTIALASTSRKALLEVSAAMTAGDTPIRVRTIRRPTQEEMAAFMENAGPKMLPSAFDDDPDDPDDQG